MTPTPTQPAPENACTHCKQPFTPKRFWQRFCSATCRKLYHSTHQDAYDAGYAAAKKELGK